CLISEMDELDELGVDVGPSHLKLSAAAHVVLPTHKALDGAREAARGNSALGTTKRGIGPAYADKAARTNLRLGDMTNPASFAKLVAERVEEHNQLLKGVFGAEQVNPEEAATAYRSYAERLAPHIVDGAALVAERLAAGEKILCEGAQGLLLDLDHGTYPYVTSSSTIAGGALTGLGFGPRDVGQVVGVAKAYTTRVGSGPFPTELTDSLGEQIREAGAEYGATTGRPRRCGWLDVVILRYAARVNGLDQIALTKLDVLSGLGKLKVAVAYESKWKRIEHFPAEAGIDSLGQWKPVYTELAGWDEDVTAARSLEDLPTAARDYIAHIEESVGVPITFISVGPERDQAIKKTA
ncbi:MAG: adenylosuccinate synthase, partial [Anaerolineales bacterium]